MRTLCFIQKLKPRLHITAEIASTNYRKHRARGHFGFLHFTLKAATGICISELINSFRSVLYRK